MKKIVIKVHVMLSEKCRTKVRKIAAVSEGVESFSLSSDEVVVTGEGVDAVCLTNKMRKKFPYATLLSVEDVKDSDEGGDEGGEDGGNQEDETTSKENFLPLPPCPICTTFLPPSPMYRHVVYDSYPNSCSIL